MVRKIKDRVNRREVASVLVDQAKKRIRRGGDSTHKYPELWAKETGIGYRKRGKPLRDTGVLMNMLSVKTQPTSNGTTWTLLDGSGYGVKHQEGFTNEGPIAIPLSAKARRIITGEPPHDIEFLDSQGLEEAPNAEAAANPSSGSIKYDYYVLEGLRKVPARKIANMPPENVKEIIRHIKRAIRG
jgi:phage gpG-like protein